jgi:hypothetical protein
MRRALGPTLTALLWLLPPAVLPLPSRTGPEGPPRPFGAPPPSGRPSPPTSPRLVRMQDRTLLSGPFPRTGLVRAVSDGSLLLSEDQATRALAVADIRAAGATVVRIPVNWEDVVAAAPAAGFDARDPSDPAYDFARIDASVSSVAAAGLQPLLVVSHAPAFAEAPRRWPYAYRGSWDPSPAALGEFATALARRYDGDFPDPARAGQALPGVRLFQAWNEPNLARYLEPQWVVRGRRWSPFSPLAYRALLNAFYAGVKSVQPHAVVVSAGVAPNGDRPGVGRMEPVTFLRALLCLDAADARCADPPHFDVLAFHPLSVASPDLPAYAAFDVAISDAAKVSGLLRQARARGTARPAGAKGLWVTELNWESAPQAASGVPPSLQAAWVSRALHRLWAAGVGLVSWEVLVDPLTGRLRASTPTGGTVEYARPAGLLAAPPDGSLADAVPKPFLTGFRLPFDPLRVDRGHVRVWALLGGGVAKPVLMQRLLGGHWRDVARLRGNAAGVLNVLVALRGHATLRLLAGRLVSAPAKVSARGCVDALSCPAAWGEVSDRDGPGPTRSAAAVARCHFGSCTVRRGRGQPRRDAPMRAYGRRPVPAVVGRHAARVHFPHETDARR